MESIKETWQGYADQLIAVDDLQNAIDELTKRDMHIHDRRAMRGALASVLTKGLRPSMAKLLPDVHETRIVNALTLSDEMDDFDPDFERVADKWLDSVLEVYLDGRYSLAVGKWEVTSVGALIAFGGPNVRVTWKRGDWVELSACWGGDTYEGSVYSPAVAAALESVVELVEDLESR